MTQFLENVGLRYILDREKQAVSLFIVVNPQSESAFWVQPERLEQLLALPDRVVTSLDSVDMDGVILKEKTVVKTEGYMVFFMNKQQIAAITVEELRVALRFVSQPIRTPLEASPERTRDILGKITLPTVSRGKPASPTAPTEGALQARS